MLFLQMLLLQKWGTRKSGKSEVSFSVATSQLCLGTFQVGVPHLEHISSMTPLLPCAGIRRFHSAPGEATFLESACVSCFLVSFFLIWKKR